MSFHPELWVKRNSTYLEPSSDLGLLLPASQYIAFGSIYGASGYGIRDNAGVMQYKNNAGIWTNFSAGGGGGSGDMLASVYDPANIAQQVLGTTATQTIQNKTLDNTNTIAVKTNGLTLQDATDPTKQVIFAVTSPTGVTRTMTFPNGNGTLIAAAIAATLTNKTIALGSNTVTGLKTDFNTALTDGDFMFVGDAPTAHTHPQSDITNLVSDLAAKQGTLTLTTTGTSGPATLVGNTLNIPQYTGGGGGGLTEAQVKTIARRYALLFG